MPITLIEFFFVA